jgi:hypothetical protein
MGTAQILWMIFGPAMRDFLMKEGKAEQAELLGVALAAIRSKKNIDADLLQLAEKWAEQGEPPLEDIVAARQAIQAQL